MRQSNGQASYPTFSAMIEWCGNRLQIELKACRRSLRVRLAAKYLWLEAPLGDSLPSGLLEIPGFFSPDDFDFADFTGCSDCEFYVHPALNIPAQGAFRKFWFHEIRHFHLGRRDYNAGLVSGPILFQPGTQKTKVLMLPIYFAQPPGR